MTVQENVTQRTGSLAEGLLRLVAGELRCPMSALTLHEPEGNPSVLAAYNMPPDLALQVARQVESEAQEDPLSPAMDGEAVGGEALGGDPMSRTTFSCRVEGMRSLAISACRFGSDGGGNGKVSPRLRTSTEAFLRMLWEVEGSRESSRMLTGVLDMFDFAVMLMDGTGHLHFANDCALRMLARADAIRRAGPAVAACNLEASVRLQTLIQRAVDPVPEGEAAAAPNLLLLPRRSASPLVATVRRISAQDALYRPVLAAVCVLDPDRNSCAMAEALFHAYGLTPSESRLALHVVTGASPSEAAERMRIRTQTARAYLKQVFWKTGTHRQVDLVRTVLNSILRV